LHGAVDDPVQYLTIGETGDNCNTGTTVTKNKKEGKKQLENLATFGRSSRANFNLVARELWELPFVLCFSTPKVKIASLGIFQLPESI